MWYKFQYFLELEWDRFTPFFYPIFYAALIHLAISTMEVHFACIGWMDGIDMENELIICNRRAHDTNECLKQEPITEKDVRRLQRYAFTLQALYYAALALPFCVPVVYWFYSFKKKDVRCKYDERTLGATQFISINVTLYVCSMPFLLAIHSEIVAKVILKSGEAFLDQNDAIWIIHGNMLRLMLLLFFKIVVIDMTFL